MTEWNGIKVGDLYKMTGRGSRGAPPLLVTAIKNIQHNEVLLTVLVGEQRDWFNLFFGKDAYYDDFEDGVQQVAYDNDNRPRYWAWPYKLVA